MSNVTIEDRETGKILADMANRKPTKDKLTTVPPEVLNWLGQLRDTHHINFGNPGKKRYDHCLNNKRGTLTT